MVEIYSILNFFPPEVLTPFFIIGMIVEILISGFVLRMSVKFAGGQAVFSRTIPFSLLIRLINLIISLFVPPIFYGFYVLILNSAIWILLAMSFFKLSFLRAILVAIVQLIITFVFILIGIPMFIQYLKFGVII